MSKQRAHSVGSAAAAAVTRVLSSTISSTMSCAASANEDSRGDDASEVVREVVRMLYVARLRNGTDQSLDTELATESAEALYWYRTMQ